MAADESRSFTRVASVHRDEIRSTSGEVGALQVEVDEIGKIFMSNAGDGLLVVSGLGMLLKSREAGEGESMTRGSPYITPNLFLPLLLRVFRDGAIRKDEYFPS